jgi:SlyX protein
MNLPAASGRGIFKKFDHYYIAASSGEYNPKGFKIHTRGKSMEERLIELETKVAFQDDTIETLNDIVAKQQSQINMLEKQLEAVSRKIVELTQSMGKDDVM